MYPKALAATWQESGLKVGNRPAINRIMTHAVMRSPHLFYIFPDLPGFMRTIFYISSSASEK